MPTQSVSLLDILSLKVLELPVNVRMKISSHLHVYIMCADSTGGASSIYTNAGEAAFTLITHLLRIFQVLRRVKAFKLSSMYVTHHGMTVQR